MCIVLLFINYVEKKWQVSLHQHIIIVNTWEQAMTSMKIFKFVFNLLWVIPTCACSHSVNYLGEVHDATSC